MNVLNSILNQMGVLLLKPLSGMPAWVALVFWSVVSGVLMAWAFKHTSNQAALKRVGDRIRASMLAMKLFKDDLNVTLRSQGALFRATMLRLWYSMPPMLVMIIPFVLVLSQLGLWYEHRPARPGETLVVRMDLRADAWDANKDVAIELPEGVTMDAPPVRAAYEHAIYWRLTPTKAGAAVLRWKMGDQTVEKRVAIADGRRDLMPVSVLRPDASFWDRIFHPGEAAFGSSSPVQRIAVSNAKRSTPIFGLNIPWWVTFLIVSMLGALASKPFTKVRF
jgi:hypothetical protein